MILFYTEIGKQEERKRIFMIAQYFLRRARLALLLILTFLSLSSCAFRTSNTLILWTDRPEFAIYAQYFNADQDRYKVEVRFFDSPAQRLIEEGEHPDIVVANWLNSASVRPYFKRLDNVFGRDGLSRHSFYPRLLALGNFDGRQFLLPVSYNIPAIVFARDFTQTPSNPFTIEMEEIKERGKAFNTVTNGVYTRMGFAPSSNDEFLFVASTLFGASFREAAPIAWESRALEQSITWIQNWISEANTSIQAEDDFAYTYFFDPPDRLVNSGRILFTYMDSARFFTLPEERRANLDFRWIAEGEKIPLDEWSVYYGIHRRTRASRAAEAFTKWFFAAETQRLLLEESKRKRLSETSFGIAGGFSAMQTVTEQVFPLFYPDLLGRMPPESFLSPPNILPQNWMAIKERVIIPYLRDRIRHSSRDEVRSLERRMSDWHRLNRS
jgi:ABC-type glycerol-3-phosphate transport system substrate-binding protein